MKMNKNYNLLIFYVDWGYDIVYVYLSIIRLMLINVSKIKLYKY